MTVDFLKGKVNTLNHNHVLYQRLEFQKNDFVLFEKAALGGNMQP